MERSRSFHDLTFKKQQVIRLILSGLSQKEVAVKLNRSPKTISALLHTAYKQLDVHSVTELALVVNYQALLGLTDEELRVLAYALKIFMRAVGCAFEKSVEVVVVDRAAVLKSCELIVQKLNRMYGSKALVTI